MIVSEQNKRTLKKTYGLFDLLSLTHLLLFVF